MKSLWLEGENFDVSPKAVAPYLHIAVVQRLGRDFMYEYMEFT